MRSRQWAIVAATLILQAPAPRTTLSPDLERAQQHDRRGWTKVDAKDYAGAIRDFEAALQIYAEYADALYGLGKARMALKEYDAAARALERARDSYSQIGTQDAEYRLLANRARKISCDCSASGSPISKTPPDRAAAPAFSAPPNCSI